MNPFFNVPILPDPNYVRFLREHIGALAAVHFPLTPDSPFDARHTSGCWDIKNLTENLEELKGPLRYALLNTRVASSNFYYDSNELRKLVDQLEALLTAQLVDGIVIADFFLLQALSNQAPDIASSLEAVPSVNCLFSSFDRITAYLEVIDASRFLPPSKIPLAPALNRQPLLLGDTVMKCRKKYPHLKMELLVNEGCLFQCPFKLSHDAGIAVNSLAQSTWILHQTLGCFAALRENPARLFKSPFIRPEDIHHYQQSADIFKICGRTLGPGFLLQTVRSYLNGRHSGNLLVLFDAMEWLAKELFIDNSLLPENFLQTVSSCDKQCASCSLCDHFLSNSSRPLPLLLHDLRNSCSHDSRE